MIKDFLTALTTVASSPLAFIAYIALLGAWVYIATAQANIKHDGLLIAEIPPSERLAFVKQRYNAQPRSGLSAEQYLRDRRQSLIFFGMIIVIVCLTAIITISITKAVVSRQRVDEIDDRSNAAVRRLGELETQIKEANLELRANQNALSRRQKLAAWSFTAPDGMHATDATGTGWIGTSRESLEKRTFTMSNGQWLWPCLSSSVAEYAHLHPELLYGQVAFAQCRLLAGDVSWDDSKQEVINLIADWKTIEPRLQYHDDFAAMYEKLLRTREAERQPPSLFDKIVLPSLFSERAALSDALLSQTVAFYESSSVGFETSRDIKQSSEQFRVLKLPLDFNCSLYVGETLLTIPITYRMLRQCLGRGSIVIPRIDASVELSAADGRAVEEDIVSKVHDPRYLERWRRAAYMRE